jgi:hypothetical protein
MYRLQVWTTVQQRLDRRDDRSKLMHDFKLARQQPINVIIYSHFC